MDEKKKDLLKEQGEAKAMDELKKADEISDNEIKDVAGGLSRGLDLEQCRKDITGIRK